MIDYLLIATSVLAIVGVALLSYGYRASLCSDDQATRYFSWSLALLATSVFWRRLTWDILHPVVTGEVDQRWPNIAFNVVAIVAVYVGLRGRWLLIPPEDRALWRWWSAWAHPSLFRLH